MKNTAKNIVKNTVAAVSMTLAGMASADTQGVSDTEVVIGSNQDMSGVFAAFGAPAMAAANLYFDEVNSNGGVHGRKIRLVIEDHGYQMPKAMSGLNKLVNSDKVFAMILNMGTPMNIASFPLLQAKGIPNISPLTASKQMTEPAASFKYSGSSSYYAQMITAVKYMKENEDVNVVCSMYIPSDFGNEIKAGSADAVKANGMTFAAETKHKPDELDFVGSLSKLKAEGCELITIALGVRQAITAIATAKKIGWSDVKFLGGSASFHTAVAKVPGGVTDGFYAAAGWSDLVARMDDPAVATWVKKYTDATGEAFPGTGALLGRSAAETMVLALEGAGRDLTQESFKTSMETLSFEDKISGVSVAYSADNHQGVADVIISKIVDGNWTELARQ